MKVLIIALISVLFVSAAYTAEIGYIQGTVIDAATGSPMPYAAVAGTTPEILVEAEQVQLDFKISDIQHTITEKDELHKRTAWFQISPIPPRKAVEYVAWGRIPELVKVHSPEYPDLARNAGVEGRLLLHIAIGDDGQVAAAYVVESGVTPAMEKAAIAAVLQFEFEPAMQRDVAVKSQMAVPVWFRLR